MPRNVRNFWLDAHIDGRDSNLSGGPVAKDGGMSVNLYVRDEGSVEHALSIRCRAKSDGTLVIDVIDARSQLKHEVFSIETTR